MGKKRKAGSSGTSVSNRNTDSMPTSKHNPEETFADSEDEFFAGKNEILLEEGPSRKRRKQLDQQEQYLQPSDEEVLGYDEDEVEEDLLSTEDEDEPDSEQEDGVQDWGISTADYYNADFIETEADALEEEAEARRLQQKQMQNMTEADFGFDNSQWAQPRKGEQEAFGTVTENLPSIKFSEDATPEERINILKNRYPELVPLAKDFTGLQDAYNALTLLAMASSTAATPKRSSMNRKARGIDGRESHETTMTPFVVVKWRALSAYLGSIAMYLALLTASASGKDHAMMPVAPNELREHPVMQTLLRARQAWDILKDMEIPEIAVAERVDEVAEKGPTETRPRKQEAAAPVDAPVTVKPKKSKKSKQVIVEEEKPAKKSKGSAKASKLDHSLAEIDDLIDNVKNETKSKSKSEAEDFDSDFGDEVALTAQEVAEKAQRKKGLRFYTSQIAQKANKRGEASRDAGGDADLPYKERLKDRQARLMREAEKRGGEKAQMSQRLDYQDESDDNAEEDARIAREVRGDADEDDDGYYDMVAHKSQQKKSDKAARATAYAEAAKIGGTVYVDDTVGPDGKRAITYEIQKNKGLMPRRKKEVRNPRVKKRMKYDEKMKKLGSVRQVWKGGEGKGGYGGELTGIKTNLVRSVKL